VQQHPHRSEGLDLCYPRAGDAGRKADVELDTERLRYLFVKESAQAPMLRIDAADEFALIPAKADAMVIVSRPRLPRRLLSGERRGEGVGVGDRLEVQRLIQPGQTSLVGEQLPNRYALLTSLGKLWPLGSDRLVEVE
jgi:hypothetical protein